MKRILIGITFLTYALIILVQCITGNIHNFLASKMIIGTIISAVAMSILGVMYLLNKKIYAKTKKIDYILILPVILIFVAGNGELSIELASNRASNLSTQIGNYSNSNTFENDEENIDYAVTDDNYMEIISYILNNVDEAEGKTIKIRGYKVTKADYIQEGYYALGKYYISCCAADAVFVGILVDEEENAQKEESQWLEIEGVLKKTISAYGEETLYIEPTNTTNINPENRYV